jgi:hypothetical protein
MFEHHGVVKNHVSRGDLSAGGGVYSEGYSGAYSIGQWAGVYGQSDSAVAKGSWSKDPVH